MHPPIWIEICSDKTYNSMYTVVITTQLCVALKIFGNLFDKSNTEVVLYETK